MNGQEVPRGPALRANASSGLFDALYHSYGIRCGDGVRDLGGSSNLNLFVPDARYRYVVRVYRPWVTTARLAAMHAVRQQLERGGVPCAQPISTLNGETWIRVDDRLVEVEPYVEYDAKMDSWERLEAGLPLLGRIHTLLRSLVLNEDGRHAPAANHIEPREVLAGVRRGTRRIRQWGASEAELQLAVASEELARLVARAERGVEGLPRQMVHGDYWDNNVLFREGRVVLVADFDFMGERARIDDLALTLYYANSAFVDNPVSDDHLLRLRTLVNAYNTGLDEPLTRAERAALPLALVRTPLCFIAMIAVVDSTSGARQLAAEMAQDITWALAIVRNLDRWQSAFV
ncbi:MAG TPA: phosphotransferase [Ardenticatenaceae bacterium]|jgi:homoserine kinase type II